ncbi:MAG: hypothetical protein PHC33_01005 [Candidatus Omnitrophica bacterium]|nr:hypothetical protein [Candidatus Omnitrophota bacterium]
MKKINVCLGMFFVFTLSIFVSTVFAQQGISTYEPESEPANTAKLATYQSNVNKSGLATWSYATLQGTSTASSYSINTTPEATGISEPAYTVVTGSSVTAYTGEAPVESPEVLATYAPSESSGGLATYVSDTNELATYPAADNDVEPLNITEDTNSVTATISSDTEEVFTPILVGSEEANELATYPAAGNDVEPLNITEDTDSVTATISSDTEEVFTPILVGSEEEKALFVGVPALDDSTPASSDPNFTTDVSSAESFTDGMATFSDETGTIAPNRKLTPSGSGIVVTTGSDSVVATLK